MRCLVAICLAVSLPLMAASASEPVTVTQLLSTLTTASGQPIVLPHRNVRLVVSRFVIPPGATLPVHKHPSQRYAYVLSGRLSVTEDATRQVSSYQQGDFIVEMRDQWHFGAAVGDQPVILLVIDQMEDGQSNTVRREAH